MNLVIFDVDGTLTDTVELDDKCFSQSLEDVFAINVGEHDWDHIKKETTGTDSAILNYLYKKHTGQLPSPQIIDDFKRYFLTLLKSSREKHSSDFKEILGAVDFFKALNHTYDYSVGIATGAWEESALLKLAAVGIELNGEFFSNASKHEHRVDMIKDVIQQASKEHTYTNIYYIGDGLWDLKASQMLGIKFIGVDAHNTKVLANNGADYVVKNYLDHMLLLDLLS